MISYQLGSPIDKSLSLLPMNEEPEEDWLLENIQDNQPSPKVRTLFICLDNDNMEKPLLEIDDRPLIPPDINVNAN